MQVGKFLGIGVLVVATGSVTVALIQVWRWNTPSAAAAELGRVVTERPAVRDADNAYLYVWGFQADLDSDASRVAAERVAWLRRQEQDPGDTSKDPLAHRGDVTSRRTPAFRQLVKLCTDAQWQECVDKFNAGSPEQSNVWDEVRLERYHALRSHLGWYETLTYTASSPLPPYADMLDGQRLEFLRLRTLADAGKVDEVREALESDLRFWRLVFRDSDILITKMIALAAVRQHFFFGNLVLRRLSAEKSAAAIPPSWTQPFTIEELSMLRTLAGELEFMQREIRLQYTADDGTVYDEDGEVMVGPEATVRRWMTGISRQVRPAQREINRFAEVYLATAKAFKVPVDQYAGAGAAIKKRFPPSEQIPDVTSYAYRAGSAEAMRCAALLTAQLRGRGVGIENMPEEVRKAALEDPLSHTPFGWDAELHAVKYDSLDPKLGRSQVYPY